VRARRGEALHPRTSPGVGRSYSPSIGCKRISQSARSWKALGGSSMNFDETLARVLELLQREGRVSYRALRRRFDLDEEYLDDLKAEVIQAKKLAVDEDGAVLGWTGETVPSSRPMPAQERVPLAYTPRHLAEKI